MLTSRIDIDLANSIKNKRSNEEHKFRILELNNKYLRYDKIYKDTSKSEHGVQCAIVTEAKSIKHRRPSQMSTFSAEAYANHDALKLIRSNNTQNHIIYSDSMSVISASLIPLKKEKIELIK